MIPINIPIKHQKKVKKGQKGAKTRFQKTEYKYKETDGGDAQMSCAWPPSNPRKHT